MLGLQSKFPHPDEGKDFEIPDFPEIEAVDSLDGCVYSSTAFVSRHHFCFRRAVSEWRGNPTGSDGQGFP